MASKLTSSLRKSISAEKQSVEDKQTGVIDNTIVEPKVAVEKPATKLAAPRKAAPRKVATKTPLPTVIKPVVENVKAATNSEKPVVEKLKANTSANSSTRPSADSVKLILEKINNSSLELSNSFVENFMGINQDFNNYLHQISEVSNLAKVQEVNEKFLDNLRKRQQELIKKNVELLSSFKLV